MISGLNTNCKVRIAKRQLIFIVKQDGQNQPNANGTFGGVSRQRAKGGGRLHKLDTPASCH